jgi:adenylate cyclase
MSLEDRARLAVWREGLLLGFWSLLAATLLARWLRARIWRHQLRLSSGRVITAPVGQHPRGRCATRHPHASVCGGRARCTTCRVRVGDGLAKLAAPSSLEAQALAGIDAPPNVRLACQTRPRSDLAVAALLPPGADPAAARRPGAPQGRERPVVAMFVDLRESTKLCESRLPYDAVFVMNQFFAAMHDALRATNGYYAQFRGDGLLALYGLDSDLPRACRDALRGAAEMQSASAPQREPRRRARRADAHRHRPARRGGHRRHPGPAGRADPFRDRRQHQHRRALRGHDQDLPVRARGLRRHPCGS